MQIEDPDRNLSVINQIIFLLVIFAIFLIITYLFPKKEPQQDRVYIYEIINGDTTKIDVTGFDSAQFDSLVHARHPVEELDSATEAELKAWQDSAFKMD